MRLVRPVSRGVVVAAGAVGALAVAGAVVAATHVGSHPDADPTPITDTGPVAPAVLHVDGLRRSEVPWNKPLVLRVTDGTLHSVAVAVGTSLLDGVLNAAGNEWRSQTALVPLAHYTITASFADQAGAVTTRVVRFAATDTDRHLRVTLSPGDGDTVGVGSPIVAQFTRAVPSAQRANVEARMFVSTTPAVVGAWHWISDEEAHWRPPTYWNAGTHVQVSAYLDNFYVGNGVWGSGSHVTSFTIGQSHISRVDVARHVMYVYENGVLIRTIPVSAGRDKYPTKNGVHITFEKSQVVTMDSATVGIPRNAPDGYYEKVFWDVRISYGGAFVHAAPWSVGAQGRVNVSHGCVNISTSNAIWFYNFALRGDVVDVYNSGASPDTSDPGMADWNMSWTQWLAGDANPTQAALALHPKMPRDYEPAAPKPTAQQTYSPPASTSPKSSPTPTHR